MKIADLNDTQLVRLIQNRWNSSESLWEQMSKIYDNNIAVYNNKGAWLSKVPVKRPKTTSNRIFTDVEAVINSLIANLPKINIIPARDTDKSRQLAQLQESYFNKKYSDRNVKEVVRKGLRNLYFMRLVVLKPFWNAKLNDFDVRSIDPRKVRFGKLASKEGESEYGIEEITDNVQAVLERFPDKKKKILEKLGIRDENDERIIIDNQEITYKEAWIRDWLCCEYQGLILCRKKNPYWDWVGLLVTDEEQEQIESSEGEERREALFKVRKEQPKRRDSMKEKIAKEADSERGDMSKDEGKEYAQSYNAYFFNHFDSPRKPYIFATAFSSEEGPFGQTDLIEQATPLQESLDRRKMQIDENADMVIGWLKIEDTVMTKAEAQQLRYETKGMVYGKGVMSGVAREFGQGLPEFVFKDLQDSRNEIDNIMAATSAFRGEREGQETKAGRLALIDQSYLRLNELVQVVDYLNYELFNWFYQLSKVFYTEYHYAKSIGPDNAMKVIDIIRDDFEDGSEVRIIPGKTLPEDRQFQFERAQEDRQLLAPQDYFEQMGYNDPKRLAKNAVLNQINPISAAGITPEELEEAEPPAPATPQIPPEQVPNPDQQLQQLFNQ